MKSRRVRGTLFLLIGLLLLHALARLVQATAPDGEAYFLRVERGNVARLLENAGTAEALVVGSSHGYDVDFAAMTYRGYQLSRPWGDVFEAGYQLRHVTPMLPRLRLVLIPISYFTFAWDNGRSQRLADRRIHLYRSLFSTRYIAGDSRHFLEARLEQVFPVGDIVREDHWKGPFYAWIGGGDAGQTRAVSGDCVHMDAAALEAHARGRVLEHAGFSAEMGASRNELGRLTLAELRATIRDLQTRGIRVVLFTPPYWEGYTRAFESGAPGAVSSMKDAMAELTGEGGIEYHDFSSDGRFIRQPQLFSDSDHLNDCGRRLFSQELERILSAVRPAAAAGPARRPADADGHAADRGAGAGRPSERIPGPESRAPGA